MKHFDEIFELAADGYGIVTAAQAREIGVTTGELSRWCATGKLMRRGHGVYKLTQWVPTPRDVFAEAWLLLVTRVSCGANQCCLCTHLHLLILVP